MACTLPSCNQESVYAAKKSDAAWIQSHRFGCESSELEGTFPFQPYDIQVNFMRELYNCVSHGKMGLFESPTGTGKTLSIICGLVTWLKHAYDSERGPDPESAQARSESSDGPDWLCDDSDAENRDHSVQDELKLPTATGARHVPKVQVIYASRTHSQLSQFLGEFAKVPAAKEFTVAAVASRKQLCVNPKVKNHKAVWRINDECLQLQSKDGTKKQALLDGSSRSSGGCGFRCKDEPAMDKFVEGILGNVMDIEELAVNGSRQAVCPYYAAREAVQKADFALVPYNCLIHRETRDVLGINLDGSIVVIDEAHNLISAINGSHSVSLSIEQLHSTSHLLLSYLNTFQKLLGTAKAATVTSVKGASDRMAAKIEDLLQANSKEARPEHGASAVDSTASRVMMPNEFLKACKLSNVNIPKLVAEMQEDHIIFKISGFAETLARRGSEQISLMTNIGKEGRKRSTSEPVAKQGASEAPEDMKGRAAAAATFQSFMQFLKELASADSAGRVLLSRQSGAVSLKYVLLDASTKHAELLDRAHSVILASGTLSPVELLTQQLCRPADLPRLHRFTCGHIVPTENVAAVALGCGPTGKRIKLTHGVREQPAVLDECGMLVNNLCRVVPQGLVVFVPSFAYCETLLKRWKSTGLDRQLAAKKRLFWESRDPVECDTMLKHYQSHLQSDPSAGALLMCVVGGKLSEGINFGDGLGRCVAVLGLPYPDLRDPELNERLMHADRCAASGAAAGEAVAAAAGMAYTDGRLGPAGRAMYTNLCMQAVNQCVGRAIRHVKDFAAIVVVDSRYTRADCGSGQNGVVAKLPHWVTQRWTDCPDGFGKAMKALGDFYTAMR